MKEIAFTKRTAGIAILCVSIALSILPALSISAQDEDVRYFEETGHSVSGEFLRFYDQRGGRAIFGYPLTRRFQDNGRQIQYFQRVRVEMHPENPEPYRVQLGLLGDELGYRQSPIPESEIPPSSHPDKRYFSETGHTVTFAFLEFYENNGGLDIFGYPITEWIIEPNGRIVQYFQRGKMEWYPENPPGQRVQLGMLGTIFVEQFVDPTYTERENPLIISWTPSTPTIQVQETPTVPAGVTEIRMMATLKHPIIGLEGEQTVYIYVFDQSNHGVPGASVEMEVQYQDGQVDHISLAATNSNGYSQVAFSVGALTPGYIVIVNLDARYGDLAAQSSTAFLPWW